MIVVRSASAPSTVSRVLITLIVVGVLALGLAGWGASYAIRDKPMLGVQMVGIGIVEAGLVIQTIVAAVQLAGGHHVADAVTVWGYLITALIILPIAVGWAFVERTRWSSVVLCIAGLVVIVMQVRIWQLWQG